LASSTSILAILTTTEKTTSQLLFPDQIKPGYSFVSLPVKNFSINSLDVPGSDYGWGINVVDQDGDHNLDILLAADSKKLQLYKGDGAGHFAVKEINVIPNPLPNRQFYVEDINNDGKLDFVVPGSYVQIFIATDTDAYSSTLLQVDDFFCAVLADLSGDDNPDLVTSTDIGVVNQSLVIVSTTATRGMKTEH
jgi:hypothetical protein